MATRMQQRRGTAAQWTAANPVLAAGEIGFETDTIQFKMGNGTATWSALSYFQNLEILGGSLDDYIPLTLKGVANGVAELDADGQVPISQLGALIDGAPLALDTLNEIAASISDDANFAGWAVIELGKKANVVSPNLSGTPMAPTAAYTTNTDQIATTKFVKDQGYATTAALTAVEGDLTSLEGTVTSLSGDVSDNTSDITALQTSLTTATGNATTLAGRVTTAEGKITTLESDVTTAKSDITGIKSVNTTQTGNITTLQGTVSGLVTDVSTNTGSITSQGGRLTTAEGSITTLQSDVTTAKSNISTLQGSLTTASATLATTTSNYNAHDAKTTSVHGIANTEALATKTYADTAGTNAVASANTYTDTAVGLRAPKASPTFTGTVTIPAGASISGFATLASPALTGTPTAPTAAAGTSTTQVATTAFVGTAVSNLVAAAPGALDTLNELATALGNDASFSTTMTNALAAKAPLASPTFTGTVSGITKSMVGLGSVDNTADTAKPISTATQTALDLKANKTADIAQKSSAYTFISTDVNMIIEHNSGTAATFTIPTDNAFWPVGQRLELLQVSSGRITVAGGAGVTVNGTPGLSTRAQWSGATIIKRAANTFVVVGDLSA
jgi:hypothetical protein